MHDDYYQLYVDEVELIAPCSPEEEEILLARIAQGDETAKKRLTEGLLHLTLEAVKDYEGRGLPAGDLVQEANMALVMAVDDWKSGDFRAQLSKQMEAALLAAVENQQRESRVEEEMLARVNVLKDISSEMAKELGREPSVEELAEKMKMSVEEIRDIMKLTLDAMSVSPDVEESDEIQV